MAEEGDSVVCSLKNFGFNYSWPRHFVQFKWGHKFPNVWFLIYRFVMLAYWLPWVYMDWVTHHKAGDDDVKFFIFLSHWGGMMQAFYNVYAFLTAIWFSDLPPAQSPAIDQWQPNTPVSLRIHWMTHTTTATISLIVFVMYWSYLYRPGRTELDAIYINNHGFNFVLMALDLMLVASPIRLFHFYLPVLTGFVYSTFAFVYTYAGGTDLNGFNQIYPVLNFKRRPLKAYGCLGVGMFVAVPVFHLLFFGIAQFRNFCFRHFTCGSETKMEELDTANGESGRSSQDTISTLAVNEDR